jgi:hypothetical protein
MGKVFQPMYFKLQFKDKLTMQILINLNRVVWKFKWNNKAVLQLAMLSKLYSNNLRAANLQNKRKFLLIRVRQEKYLRMGLRLIHNHWKIRLWCNQWIFRHLKCKSLRGSLNLKSEDPRFSDEIKFKFWAFEKDL